ncbi:MAG: tetrahydromethanopterin S-methyltransferase subunit H [Methanobacteriota archaeon]|nr:MAG: tetrahydromethanopterin S-methyltransferase subunit H [Euryarchaeota archaeon]
MFRFERPQAVVEIGGVRFGGQPGENPTMLLGTMFYNGHKIVEKRKGARFDRKRAEELINRQETLSDETGVPGMLDLVANFPEEIEAYIDFVASVTDMPFATDIWTVEPKLAAARHVAEVGLLDRYLYNSIAPWSKDLERETAELRDLGVKNALLVAFNTADRTPEGRIRILEDLLIPAAEKAGVKNILVDTSVLNIPATAFSILGGLTVKEAFGYPVGCAPSNGTDMWKTPKERWGKLGFAGVDSAAHAVASLYNDFLLYGPIESAPWIFPAVAAADSILSTFRFDEEGALPEPGHPLSLHFPEFVEELGKGGREG